MSTEPLTRTVRALINEGRGDKPTDIVLGYDPADPFAVTFTLPGEAETTVTWSVQRNLLWNVLQRPMYLHADSGVTIRAYCAMLVVTLFDEGAQTGVWVHRGIVAQFLEASFLVCPPGSEKLPPVDVDATLARILGEGAAS